MADTTLNIVATVPPVNGQGTGIVQNLSGNKSAEAEKSSDLPMTFMDFVLARVTSLQSDESDINAIVQQSQNDASIPTSDKALLSIAEFLSPFEQGETAHSLNLDELPEDAKVALKELSTAILSLADKGKVELSDTQFEALTALSNIEIDSTTMAQSVAASAEENLTETSEELINTPNHNQDENIVITIDDKKVVIPMSLDNLVEIPASDKEIPLLAIKDIVEQLEKIASLSKATVVAQNSDIKIVETEENPEAIATLLNKITPSDNNDEIISDEENVVVASTVQTIIENKTVSPTPLKDAVLSSNTVPTTDIPVEDGKNVEGKILSDKKPTDSLIKAATSQGSDTKTPAGKANFAQSLTNNIASAETPITDEVMDAPDELLKSADALIQSDAKSALLKAGTSLSQSSNSTAAEQVSIQVFKAAVKGDTKVTIKLHPEELGKVDIKLEMTADGKAKAIVIADNSDTLNMLTKDSAQLQRALNEAGLDAQSSDLSFQLNDKNNNQAFSSPNNNFGNNATGSDVETLIDTTTINQEDILLGEYSVNYKV